MEPDRWHGVEIRHLAALRAVAETGSFGRAAERLGYTQSAVSQQIATLEKAVGTRLVERPGGPRPISITEAGNVLLRHADGIVARLRAAQADLAALADIVGAGRRACLLCLEADPTHCHRSLVADALARRMTLDIVHLHPEPDVD